MGLDISSAIKLFLRTVVATQSIPFKVRTKNGFTLKQEREMIRETEEALREGKGYRSAEEMHTAILAEDNND